MNTCTYPESSASMINWIFHDICDFLSGNRCPTPPEVHQATIRDYNVTVNSSVTYNCNHGYQTSPGIYRTETTCQDGGTWSQINETCEGKTIIQFVCRSFPWYSNALHGMKGKNQLCFTSFFIYIFIKQFFYLWY